ncbi:MAG: hypothetical protein J6U14_10030 [Bacteroidaceae bacterium]|nr:hypothetical protein [Bacteroidaceae bacterium]
MIILSDPKVEDFLNHIYTDYSIAYVGREFSDAFKKWNYAFCLDVTTAIKSYSTSYTGRTCTLEIEFKHSSMYGMIAIIFKCEINMSLIRYVESESNDERIKIGLPPVSPSTLSAIPIVDVSKSPIQPKPKPKTPFVLPSGITVLDDVYYAGMKIGYYGNMYVILNADGTPFIEKWFKSEPHFLKKPYGKYGIIAHVNFCGSLFAVSIDKRMYDTHRLWKDAYIESYKHYVDRIISESINNFFRGIVKEDRDVRIRRIVRESIDRFINQIVA